MANIVSPQLSSYADSLINETMQIYVMKCLVCFLQFPVLILCNHHLTPIL